MARTEGQIRWTTERATKDFNDAYLGHVFQSSTLELVIEHYQLCSELTDGTAVTPRFRDWWGMSREQIVTQIESIAKRLRKGAGKRALIAKLGREGAQDYISWKAGRPVQLK